MVPSFDSGMEPTLNQWQVYVPASSEYIGLSIGLLEEVGHLRIEKGSRGRQGQIFEDGSRGGA